MNTRCYFFVTIILASLTVFCNCYDAIIIGAGASGIAAGMYLLENGFHNFIILEAENRIGGRIQSQKFGESLVDLGAEWCLGEESNKFYTIAKDNHLLTPVNENYTFISSDNVWYITLTENQLLECRRNFSDMFQSIRMDHKHATLSDAFFKYYDMHFISKIVARNPKYLKFCMETLKLMSQMALTHESFYSWDDIPAKHNYEKFNGQLQHFDGLGFHTFLKIMMDDFPNPSDQLTIRSKIRYYSYVRKIIWGKGNTSDVIVRSTTGKYTAKHIIFTPSLGVLKKKHSTLFEPGLPQHKIDAINCLGFEGTIKVFLKYSNPWWGKEEFQPTILVWRAEEKLSLEVNYYRNRTQYLHRGDPNTISSLAERDPSWLYALTQLLPSPNNPAVIEAWFTGEKSKEIEHIPDEVLINGIMIVFKTFYRSIRDRIGNPDSILRSKWNTNPHFLGTHSYETRTPSPFSDSCNVDLATPLFRNGTPVVLFAGEATSKHHYSTVHGAIEAGKREGRRLLNTYD